MHLVNSTLYGIIDLGYVSPSDLIERTEQLIAGGVDLIQLRAKRQSESDITTWARQIQPLCQSAGIPFIVNDYPEIALAVGADGVHIGQDDGTLADVRQVVGDQMLVGRSTHSGTQAQAAWAEGFDYIGFGPLFPTATKKGRPAIGLDEIAEVESTVGAEIPVYCIGGIKPANLDQVMLAGARRVVIVSGLLCAENPRETTASVKAQLS